MKEHRDTAPTPTSLRREQQPRNKRVRRVPMWRDDKRVNEWCGWRMSVAQVPQVREFDASQQVWS
jgi:hypothetical protein